MRIAKIDQKTRVMELVPEVNDDLWHLERVLEKGDLVSGSTDRKIKPRKEGEKSERIKLFLTVEAEKIDFHRETGNLRVTGSIRAGKPQELVEQGASHSIEIGLGKKVSITKKEMKKFQIQRIEKASKATKQGKLLLVALDDERADFAVLKEFELEKKGSVRSGKSGKMFGSESSEGDYFKNVMERVQEIGAETIVIAGPGFAKEGLKKWINGKGIKGGFHFASINSVGITGLNELVKGNAIEKVVQEKQLVKDTRMVEAVLEELGKGTGLVEYGFEEVGKAVEAGAVKELLVADSFMLENREKAEQIMANAEKTRSNVHIIDAENEAGKKLSSLGGVAALLRYRIA